MTLWLESIYIRKETVLFKEKPLQTPQTKNFLISIVKFWNKSYLRYTQHWLEQLSITWYDHIKETKLIAMEIFNIMKSIIKYDYISN